MTEIYASDLDPRKANDGFMGERFEKAMKKAEDNGDELVVGEFYPNKKWRVD